MDIERLGPYQIVGELGRGGMGSVYKAVHSETGEPAAVKLLSPHLAHEEGFRSRFEAEIETLRMLRHPNIVRLFGFGEEELYLFYAMELVDGSSLEQELQRGRRFDWREVARISVEMCRALRHAHDRGVIHRDIKPGNVLLATDGRVKLSDFGIARLFGYSRLTGAGNVLGTAEYMAPEQAEGRPVDARADLYSLGALMYALLARRPLFRGKSLPDMLYKQRFEQPEPIRNHVADLPSQFEQIIGQLLEKEPERRIPNADVLARRLEAMLGSNDVVGETLGADPSWFHVQPSQDVVAEASVPPPLSEVPDTLEIRRPTGDLESDPSAASLSLSEATDEKAAATSPVPPELPRPAARFVVVSDDELDKEDEEERRPAMISWQTWALVAALVLLFFAVRWFLQPATADALYGRVKARAADGSIGEADADIREFLKYYSNDPRAAELQSYEKQISLDELQRKFDSPLMRRLNHKEHLSPLERAYDEAMNYVRLDPERGVAKLQAILDLYDQPEAAGTGGQFLILVERRLAQLKEEIKKRSAEQLDVLQNRLKAADDLRENDPARALAMYRAVVELYADKPWAADAVRRAREALSKPPRPAKSKQGNRSSSQVAPKK
jgi:eukaryotic-like serine/threonine-protein kinase